jgi:hypothetical protein
MDTNMRWEGYWDIEALPIKAGDTVIIRKGTSYWSVKDGARRIAGKTYFVKCDHVITGSMGSSIHSCAVTNPEVIWAGSGRYWCRADINDVEKVDMKELKDE